MTCLPEELHVIDLCVATWCLTCRSQGVVTQQEIDSALQQAASAAAPAPANMPAAAPKQRGRRSSKAPSPSQQPEQVLGDRPASVAVTVAQDFDVVVLERHEGPAPAIADAEPEAGSQAELAVV
jgi:hypothetical protein